LDLELFVALFSVIGIGWLTIVPTYRGWGHIDRQMAQQVETTLAALGGTKAPDPSKND
jgi:hypothetical protein